MLLLASAPRGAPPRAATLLPAEPVNESASPVSDLATAQRLATQADCISMPWRRCLGSDARSEQRNSTIASDASSADNESEGPAIAPRTDVIALCVTGAARSFLDMPEMADSLSWAISNRPVDIFFHVFVGEELSARGMEGGDLLSQAQRLNASIARLVGSGARVVDVRVQTEENDFDCGQMSNGRFFKMGRCARTALEHGRITDTSYSIFALARPDLSYQSKFPPEKCLAPFTDTSLSAPLVWQPRASSTKGESELTIASFSGLPVFTDLAERDEVECCDEARREPADCFLDNHEEPSSNYIYQAHLQKDMQDAAEQLDPECEWAHSVVRSPDKAGTVVLHGEFRDDVARALKPREQVRVDSLEILLASLQVDESLCAKAPAWRKPRGCPGNKD